MAKYLDYSGLSYFWQKIKTYVDAHSGGGGGGVINIVIGARDFSSTSLASGTAKALSVSSGNAYATIPKGKWVINGMVRFNSNATGYRGCWISTTSGGSAIAQAAKAQVQAANGDQTYVHFSYIVTLNANTNYYLCAIQNSGSAINAIGYLRWFGTDGEIVNGNSLAYGLTDGTQPLAGVASVDSAEI